MVCCYALPVAAAVVAMRGERWRDRGQLRKQSNNSVDKNTYLGKRELKALLSGF